MISQQLLFEAVQQRILILDGAMGTQLQQFRFTESDFRGDRFADFLMHSKETTIYYPSLRNHQPFSRYIKFI